MGADSQQVIDLAETLAELYDAWGKLEQAAEWRATLPPLQETVASDRP